MADYSGEISLGYENLNAKLSGDDIYLAGITLYPLTPLSYLGKTPHDEAAFFNQIAQADFVYGRTESSVDDFNAYGVAYTHQTAQSPHGFSLSWFGTDFDLDFDAYQAGYHYYLGAGFTVGADVAMADFDGDRAWSYGFNSKRLFSLERDRWIALEGGFGWSNDGDKGERTLDALATYYPTAKSGIGIGVATTDRFTAYDTVLTATHYFRDNLAVILSYNRSIIKDDSDTDGVSVGGKFRF